MKLYAPLSRQTTLNPDDFCGMDITGAMLEMDYKWMVNNLSFWNQVEQVIVFCIDRGLGLKQIYVAGNVTQLHRMDFTGAVLEFEERSEALLFKLSWPTL